MKRKQTTCFTLIELLIVISIISILASLLLPALHKSKELAKISQCMNNVKQHGIAYGMYAGDFNSWLPPWRRGSNPWVSFENLLASYLGIEGALEGEIHRKDVYFVKLGFDHGQVFRCPSIYGRPIEPGSIKITRHCYYQNYLWGTKDFYYTAVSVDKYYNYPRLTMFRKTAESILMFDLWQWQLEGSGDNDAKPYNAHKTGRNVLYVDGHVSKLGRSNDRDWGSSWIIKTEILKVY